MGSPICMRDVERPRGAFTCSCNFEPVCWMERWMPISSDGKTKGFATTLKKKHCMKPPPFFMLPFKVGDVFFDNTFER